MAVYIFILSLGNFFIWSGFSSLKKNPQNQTNFGTNIFDNDA